MSTTSQAPAAPTARPSSPARRRILDTAHRLFYADGIHAVGIDRLIAEAGVAKATFYHHFPAKDDLVSAYLAEQSGFQRAAAESLRAQRGDPIEALRTIFDAIAAIGCGPGFRGCPFVNAAAEYPDPAHQVRLTIAAHRAWFRTLLRDLLTEAGHPDPERTADLLHVLRDGLVIAAQLDDPATIAAQTQTALTRLLHP